MLKLYCRTLKKRLAHAAGATPWDFMLFSNFGYAGTLRR
jgi:hypothetical protein